MAYPIHAAEIFAHVVERYGDRAALHWSTERSTSFAQLDGFSNQFAHLLLSRGVRKGDTICLSLEKGVWAYSAMIGCLKIGAPYFFVDPANPPARTQAIVNQCLPVLAAVDSAPAAALFGCPAIVMSPDDRSPHPLSGIDPGPVAVPWSVEGSDPAYVMFTSGSTGVPKGATISHGNLANFIHWSQVQFQTSAADVFTNVNPLFFDNSVFDIYASLFAGASLVPFSASIMSRPADVLARMTALGCSVYFSVPSLLVYFQALKLVDRGSFPTLRVLIFGGEGYPKAKLAELFACVGRRVALINVYGPTECTCICSCYRIQAADLEDVKGFAPLGTLIPNFSFVVVDEDGRVVSNGDAGELCLGGPCVGLGYFADPAQTAKVFTQNPTHARFFDRMYRTGDLVRQDPATGTLYFVGRADTQVKHQGYRIELGEIEHGLAAIAGVHEAVAVYVGRIVAVVACSDEVQPSALRRVLIDSLPKYMVPDRIVVMTELPKNANGKVDRKGITAAVANGEL